MAGPLMVPTPLGKSCRFGPSGGVREEPAVLVFVKSLLCCLPFGAVRVRPLLAGSCEGKPSWSVTSTLLPRLAGSLVRGSPRGAGRPHCYAIGLPRGAVRSRQISSARGAGNSLQ